MKLIYLHQYFKLPTENGGTRSYDLAQAFAKKGIEVEIVTTISDRNGFNGQRWRTEQIADFKVHYMHLPYDNSFSYVKRLFVFLSFIFFSTIRILRIKADLVLATSTPLTIGIPAIFKRLLHGTPFIFEVRDVWPEAVVAVGAIRNKILIKLLVLLESLIYKSSAIIVPLSVDMKTSILNRYPTLASKIPFVIENIAEVNRFRCESNLAAGAYLEDIIGFRPKASILYAGTFGTVNNIGYVIDLAEKILQYDQDIVFLLLGTGAHKSSLIRLAKEKGIYGKNVFFIPPVSKTELPMIYNAATLGASFVAPIPALWANSANKFFDTLAAGRPILINHGGWQAELIRNQKVGFVLDASISVDNILKFLDYIRDDEIIRSSGIRARQIAESEFSLEIAVEKYLKIFKIILIN